jgi:hypothetical protein
MFTSDNTGEVLELGIESEVELVGRSNIDKDSERTLDGRFLFGICLGSGDCFWVLFLRQHFIFTAPCCSKCNRSEKTSFA